MTNSNKITQEIPAIGYSPYIENSWRWQQWRNETLPSVDRNKVTQKLEAIDENDEGDRLLRSATA
jgi:hypothetical protein